MKAYLKFNLPEEEDDMKDAINGSRYKYRLESVWEEIFRPRHKHGYKSEVLNKVFYNFEKEKVSTEDIQKAMDELEDIYRSIIRED